MGDAEISTTTSSGRAKSSDGDGKNPDQAQTGRGKIEEGIHHPSTGEAYMMRRWPQEHGDKMFPLQWPTSEA